jgi:polyisoprenoid-binding protein YceI
MGNSKRWLAALSILLALSFNIEAKSYKSYTVDPTNSTVRFEVDLYRSILHSIKFEDLSGSIALNLKDQDAHGTLGLKIASNSILSNSQQMRDLILSDHILSAHNFPHISIDVESIRNAFPAGMLFTGNVVFKDKKLPFERVLGYLHPPFVDDKGNEYVVLETSIELNLQDLGIRYQKRLQSNGRLELSKTAMLYFSITGISKLNLDAE